CLLDRVFGFPPDGMTARGRVAVELGDPRNHLLGHARVDRRSSGIVEIDRSFTHTALKAVSWIEKSSDHGVPGPSACEPAGIVARHRGMHGDSHGSRLGLPFALTRLLLIGKLLQGDRMEVIDHLAIQRRPELVRHALPRATTRATDTVL